MASEVSEWVALGDQHGLDIVPWFEWGLKVPADSPLAAKHPEKVAALVAEWEAWAKRVGVYPKPGGKGGKR